MYLKCLVVFFITCFYSKVHFVTSFSVIPNLLSLSPSELNKASSKTIGELRETGRNYRHPDSAEITYPKIVKEPLGTINETNENVKSLNIAVIGGGVAGIAAIYELSRIHGAKEKLNVTLFESDQEHFTKKLECDLHVEAFSSTTWGKRAGRVFAAESRKKTNGTVTKHAVYEIGAMRFPEIAGLTWHYVSEAFGNDSMVATVFPNPGVVPTEFVHGERVDRFHGNESLDKNSPTMKVFNVTRLGLKGDGTKNSPNVSLFPINGTDPAKISNELNSNSTTPDRLKAIKKAWKEFAEKYDNVTLGAAVKYIISERLNQLDDVKDLHTKESKINYYVELFGRFGFGTGGFRPMYNSAMTEIMRLILWQYDNEYMLPVSENVQFISKLFCKAKSSGMNITVVSARVSDVCHIGKGNTTKAAVIFYKIKGTEPNPEPSCSEEPVPVESKNSSLDTFDYVILAVTPKQANSIVSRAGFLNEPSNLRLGDHDLTDVRPALILNSDPEADAANSEIYKALNQVHMITSSKVFATINKTSYDNNARCFNGSIIKAILSDCGLATTYIMPSPLQKESDPDEKKFYSILLSYAWEDDTKSLQNEFLKYPKNVGCDGHDTENEMLKRIISRTIRHVLNPTYNSIDNDCRAATDGKPKKYESWWFGKLLNDSLHNGSLTDALSYDWTTHHTSGAFKLSAAGDYYNSHLLFRYHTHALKASQLQNRFFLAGDSYTHLGGWIEGAFMSSVNAVCGLIVAANQGNVSALTKEAQIVMDAFDSVA